MTDVETLKRYLERHRPGGELAVAIRSLLELSERRRVELKEEAGKALRFWEENERLRADLKGGSDD